MTRQSKCLNHELTSELGTRVVAVVVLGKSYPQVPGGPRGERFGDDGVRIYGETEGVSVFSRSAISL